MDYYKRLYRSRKNKIIAGVCGGIGEYFKIDPVIIRILAVIIPGFSWVAYLILAIILPEEPA
jgi:phage shock protein C